MQLSVRTHLIAGTAAVVGAGAIAMTPMTQAHQLLPTLQLPSAAEVSQVALAGFDSPLSELIGTISSFNQWLVSSDNTTAGYTALGGLTDADGVNIAQTVLNFNAVGILPQIVNDHAPFLTMLGLNGAKTLESTLNAATTIALIGSEAAWNLPGAFVTAAQQAVSGDISGAITTLQNAIVTPFVEAGQVALDNINYLVSDTIARSNALNQAIPALADLVVKGTIGQASTLADAFINVAQNIVAGISAGSAEQVWNAAVDGVFGPTGIPGTILNLTVGAGVQVSSTSIIPSVRGEIQAVVHDISTALSATGSVSPVPPPTVAATTSASAVSAAATTNTTSSSSGTSGSGTAASATKKSVSSHAKSSSTTSGTKHGVAGSKRSSGKS